MRKILIGLMVVFLCAGISGISFAKEGNLAKVKSEQPRAEVWKGKIVAIDNATNEVTLQVNSGVEKIFKADSKQLASLKQGEEVKISLQPGSNVAQSIKVVSKKHHKKLI